MPERTRAIAPLVGTVVLLACCVALCGIVAASFAGAGSDLTAPTPAVFALSASADGTVDLVYRAGPPLDVEGLDVSVTVDGRPLRQQPAVPFVGERGFDGAPTGPFNAAADSTWRAGDAPRS
uniref:hypothetical protein n=1 Tax=Halarchaeum acidiphilum TaxID=489138 RepID=UPI00036DED92